MRNKALQISCKMDGSLHRGCLTAAVRRQRGGAFCFQLVNAGKDKRIICDPYTGSSVGIYLSSFLFPWFQRGSPLNEMRV